MVSHLAHNQEVVCSNHTPATSMNGKTAKQAPEEPMHKVTFHILDPITQKGIDIVQEVRGCAGYIASHFHSDGIIVESPNGDSTWYNPSSIVRMHFRELAEKPVKAQTLMSKIPPMPLTTPTVRSGDQEPEDDIDEYDHEINAPVGVPF